MIYCARCYNRFDPDAPGYAVCPGCYSELLAWNDSGPETMAMYAAVGKLLNLDMDMMNVKELADSGGGQGLIKLILDGMDLTMKGRLIRQQAEQLWDMPESFRWWLKEVAR